MEEQLKKEIINFLVKIDIRQLEYFPFVKNNKEFIIELVKQNWKALVFASAELRGDKEVVLEAVKTNSNALQYASDELKADKEFILEVARQNGWSLEYTNYELRSDKEVYISELKEKLYYQQLKQRLNI